MRGDFLEADFNIPIQSNHKRQELFQRKPMKFSVLQSRDFWLWNPENLSCLSLIQVAMMNNRVDLTRDRSFKF